jgi:hypothetical protein
VDLRTFGFLWGVFGVAAFLGMAVWRVSAYVLELRHYGLSPLQWGILIVFTVYMVYAEGIKGFYRRFAPRVVARACYLRENSRPFLTLFAPVFCMGYIHSTLRRRLTSFGVTGGIALLVVGVRHVPQPWRGIIDCGVVVGLFVGVLSVLWFGARAMFAGETPEVPLDLP